MKIVDKIGNAYFREYFKAKESQHKALGFVYNFGPLAGLVGMGVAFVTGLGLLVGGVAVFSAFVTATIAGRAIRNKTEKALNADIANGTLIKRYDEALSADKAELAELSSKFAAAAKPAAPAADAAPAAKVAAPEMK